MASKSFGLLLTFPELWLYREIRLYIHPHIEGENFGVNVAVDPTAVVTVSITLSFIFRSAKRLGTYATCNGFS